MGVRFGVFCCNAQVKNMGIEHKNFFGYFKRFNLDMLSISSQSFSQMNIVAIAAKTFTAIWFNLNGSFFYLLQYAQVRKNHEYFEFLLMNFAAVNDGGKIT